MFKLNLACCVCKKQAEYVKELDSNKGFKYYCGEHFNNDTKNYAMQIKKILDRR